MPVGFNSPARNLFLLGSSGAQVVTNFFKTIDQSAGSDQVYLPDEIKYNDVDQKFVLAGSASDSQVKGFGWLEKRQEDGTQDWGVRVESTQSGVNTKLRALHLDSNDNLIVVGGVGDIPWIAKYSNGGVIDWQSTTNSANVEYTGVTSDSNGNYYACGLTPSSGDAQAFVEKFDANGNPGWGKSAFMLGRDVVLEKIAANDRGEVVAVGLLQDDEAYKGYIVKIDTNTGEVLWDRTLRSYEDNVTFGYTPVFCEDVFIDSKDQIYIVGRYYGISESRGFIVKYTAEGNMIWQKETPVGENIEYYEVKSDGETEQTIVFGRYFDSVQNDWGGILSKYSKNGDLVWRRTLFSSYNNSDTFGQAGGKGICLDADPSFYYLMYIDDAIDELNGTPESYTFGKVSSSGNGLGGFEYAEGTGETLYYDILNVQDKIGRLSDGSVRNDTSDLITYPFNANNLLFDDLATQVSNKKRQMDGPDSFEYSGSPAIRPADFQELNLLGDVYSGSGDWLDQSGKGNNGVVNGATHNAAGYWEFDGTNDEIDFGNEASIITSGSFTVEAWAWRDTRTNENGLFNIEDTNQGVILLSAGSTYLNGDYRFLVRKGNYGAGPVQANIEGSITGHGLNEWHHYLGTYDDDTGTIIMYVDGVQVDTDTNASIIGVNFSGTLDSGIHIGPSAGRGRWHDGRIGEVRVYPRALTAAQVFQNYNATKSKYLNEAPDIAPKIGPGIVYDSNLLLNYDFGNRATYDRVENLANNSETFENWTANGSRATITPNQIVAPDGSLTADMIEDANSGSGNKNLYQYITITPAETYTASLYVKAGTSDWANWYFDDTGVSFQFSTETLSIDPNSGPLGGTSGAPPATAGFDNVGNGWYRLYLKDVYASSASRPFGIWTGANSQIYSPSYIGDPQYNFYIWGAQVEKGSTPGRYIKTSGTAITAPTTVKNLSSNSINLPVRNGAIFNSGGWFDFDGTNQDIWDGSPQTIVYSGGTFEAWLYFDDVSNNRGFMSHSAGGTGPYINFYMPGASQSKMRWEVIGITTQPYETILSNTVLTTGQWYHFVGTFNGTDTITLYVNGTQDAQDTNMTNQPTTNNAAIRLAEYAGFMDGRIGEARIYNRALSATEVSQNFNATRAKYSV